MITNFRDLRVHRWHWSFWLYELRGMYSNDGYFLTAEYFCNQFLVWEVWDFTNSVKHIANGYVFYWITLKHVLTDIHRFWKELITALYRHDLLFNAGHEISPTVVEEIFLFLPNWMLLSPITYWWLNYSLLLSKTSSLGINAPLWIYHLLWYAYSVRIHLDRIHSFPYEFIWPKLPAIQFYYALAHWIE